MRVLAPIACLAGLLAFSGCQKGAKNGQNASLKRQNLVLVTIDTLRPDRLGCYGYRDIATPHLDRLAASGTLFENAVTDTPLTAPSHAGMFTGVYPTVHKVRDTGGFVLNAPNPTLAEILERQGWQTAAFVGASVLKKGFGFDRGFAVYDDRMPAPRPGADADIAERRAGEVVDRALAWLGQQKQQPWFLWVHVFDPHSPYDPPAPFKEQYRGRPYDGEVAYTDRELGRLFDALDANTLKVVLSDHGESLSEHGEHSHGVFLYDATVRVASIFSGPGVPKGARVKQQARTIDVLPTVLELMGGKSPEGVQGASLVPAMAGKEDPGTWAYAETLYPKINMGWAELRGIRTNRWKYIRAPKPELYDLAADPAESNNIIASHPAEAQDFEKRLQTLAAADEKVQTSMVDRRTLDQLKSLGYLGGSSHGEYTLDGKGIDPKDRTAVLDLLYRAMSPDAGAKPSGRVPALREALAQDPGNPTVYYYLGDEYGRAGRHGEALALYRQALHHGVRNAWLYSRLGRLYVREGKRDEAILAYERAAQLNPSDCESISDLGMVYLDTNRPADAERVYKWCLATEPYAPAYNGLGLAAVRKRDMTAARGYFEQAVEADPDLLEAQLNLGRIYKMIGADTRARACFEAFLKKADPAEYGHIIPKIKAEAAELARRSGGS